MAKKKIKHKFFKKPIIWGSFLLVTFIFCVYLIVSGLFSFFYSKFPEIIEVQKVVQSQYKHGDVQVNSWFTTSGKGEDKKTTSRFVVTYKSNHFLEERDIRYIGKITCDKLKELNKQYDNVTVVTSKSSLPFNIPYLHIGVSYSYPGKC